MTIAPHSTAREAGEGRPPEPAQTPEGEATGPTWIVDRIDFVGAGRGCLFCGRPLTSRVARWVVEPRTGEPKGEKVGHPAGPTCARRHARRPEGPIPDFTRAAVGFPDEEHDADQAQPTVPYGAARGSARGGRDVRAGDGARATEYLRLRYEKLAGFPGVGANDRLDAIYWRTLGHREPRAPSERDLAYVRNLVALLDRRRSSLAPRNLQAAYAYGFWARALLEADFHPTVAGILRSLKDNLTLTPKQVGALNAFFANRSGFPTLDPAAFAGVGRGVREARTVPRARAGPRTAPIERGRGVTDP